MVAHQLSTVFVPNPFNDMHLQILKKKDFTTAAKASKKIMQTVVLKLKENLLIKFVLCHPQGQITSYHQ